MTETLVNAWAVTELGGSLTPHRFTLLPPAPDEVHAEVVCCGVCRTDLDVMADPEAPFPRVPGHEIVGIVRRVGTEVRTLALGQRVGIGWQCGACFDCSWCDDGLEQHCADGVATCDHRPGGFAELVRVDARFAHPLPESLRAVHAAPLLCAGTTVYAALSRWASPGESVAVLGIGGLGHLALAYARAMGYRVDAISSSRDKAADARRLGADAFHVLGDSGEPTSRYDVVLSTVPVSMPFDRLLAWLRPRGRLCFVGLPPATSQGLRVHQLVDASRAICGSVIGSRREVREALALAAEAGILPLVEEVPMRDAPAAVERLRAHRARYRLVLRHAPGDFA